MTRPPEGPAKGDLPEWRGVLGEARRIRKKQYLRVSRKMLNHLCSIGLADAQTLLAEIDLAEAQRVAASAANVPEAKVSLEESLEASSAIFDLAAEYLGDDEIMSRITKWKSEDKARFFSAVVGNSRSSMPEIAKAIRLYDDVLRGRSGLPLSTLKSLRVSLIQRFLTEQLDFINVAKEVVRITDFLEVVDHVIMTEGCHGKLGGKTAGMLLARWILEQPDAQDRGLDQAKIPRTFCIISDAVMDFVKLNELDDVMDQKFKEISQVRREYPNMIQLFKNSTFPTEVITGLSRALDYFGDVPLIIRSSSLLEDRFGTAFSGKYKSLFIANQGTKQERLEAVLDAVAEVWASVLGPDPIEYRRERGLQEFVEEMGILIQEVIGTRVGKYWFPAFAGVAFSRNEFRWSPRIRKEDGLIRLVPGLGTRAVDRVGDDFPVLAVPGQPGLRSSVSVEETLRYSPTKADVINLEANRFETVELNQLLAEAGDDYPLVHRLFSVYRDGGLHRVNRLLMQPQTDDLVCDMEGLLSDTPMVPQIRSLLNTLEAYLGTPVDIEFAHDGKDFYLLQCRPQAQTLDAAPAVLPRDVPTADLVFSARKHVSNGWVPDITHVVYVVPEAYGALPTEEAMRRVGRAVSELNRILPKRKFILMGPGRWGSRGDIKLGVRVTYADINNTAVLIEVARRQGSYVPDVSFGTHFFQDLVEASIRYLPLYPDDPDVAFNTDFLGGDNNILADLLPEFADLAECVRVIDVGQVSGGRVLRVLMNSDQEEAMAVLQEPATEERAVPTAASESQLHEPVQFWRWRFRMAERMIRSLNGAEGTLAGAYLYGSVKNGTAGPDSDIDLLVHFRGDECDRQKLETYFSGWDAALVEMNYSRTGVRMDHILDVTFLTDADVASGRGLAQLIGAVTNEARPLDLV